MSIPAELTGTITLKANIYFEGKVLSHTITTPGFPRRTIGLIYPGEYTFNTDSAERMDILSGACRVRQAGSADWTPVHAGASFHVPAKSRFDIAVDEGIAEYLCTFA